MARSNTLNKVGKRKARQSRRNVAGAQQAPQIHPGVDMQRLNNYIPAGGEYCRCTIRTAHGRICNALIFNNPASLISHISSYHTAGSAYQRDQAANPWFCECKPGAKYKNWSSARKHIEVAHGYKGASKNIKKDPNNQIHLRGDGTVLVPSDDEEEEEEEEDEGLTEDCSGGVPTPPEKSDDEDEDGGGGSGGGGGFGFAGFGQAIQV